MQFLKGGCWQRKIGVINRQIDKSGYKEIIYYGRVFIYLSGLIDVLNVYFNKYVFGDL